MDLMIKGLIIGISIAAPVGPIGLLCIQRSLSQGLISGLFTGIGAATADAVYGCIAAIGLDIVTTFLINQQEWIRLVGGGLLCYLGMRSIMAKPAERAALDKNRGIFWNYFSTFLLTITNPLTILSFVAVFASLGIAGSEHNYVRTAYTIVGVFLGSALWWLILSSSMTLFRKKLDLTALRWMNRISGVIIIAFGIYGMISISY